MKKAQLAESCWNLLGQTAPKDITIAHIAEASDTPLQDAIIYGGDITDLVLFQLDHLDSQALAFSADDFADDPHASIYEKLLEGLMMRFETLAPYRAQFAHLHDAATKNPLLGAHCLHQLSHTVGKLLHLAGDDSQGARKQARIMGVVGVLLRVRPVWAKDETSDLGLTIKALDDELKKACEWAVSLRILSGDDVKGASKSTES